MWWPVRRVFGALLAGEPVPQHVAFIMDGNRRYADQAGVEALEGHTSGYSKMVDVIQWCFELGVRHVSVYAFSIDNFRRDASEVEGLMRLAADKFDALMKDESARAWGAELRVLGDLSRAPPGVQAASARLMRSSAALCAAAQPAGAPIRRVVNVCFSYTSTEELDTALTRIRTALTSRQLLPADVDAALLCAAMHTGTPLTGGSPPVDLMVRTSGEERLSDFLLWQSGGALLSWLPVLWPQLGFLDLVRALRDWQEARPGLCALNTAAAARQDERLGSDCSGSRGASSLTNVSGTSQGACRRSVACATAGAADSLRCGGGTCTNGTTAAAGPSASGREGPAAGALERAASSPLSSISEHEPSCAPHPSKQLRIEGFLRSLEVQRQDWIAATLGERQAVPTGAAGCPMIAGMVS